MHYGDDALPFKLSLGVDGYIESTRHATGRDRPNGYTHVNIFLSVMCVYLSVLGSVNQSPCLPLLSPSPSRSLFRYGSPSPIPSAYTSGYKATRNTVFVCGMRSHSTHTFAVRLISPSNPKATNQPHRCIKTSPITKLNNLEV